MTEQLTLLATDPEPEAPRCRMCARPARWLTTQDQYAMYCAGRACSNRERICQACGETFHMGLDGAGTKYCSTDCKIKGYKPDRIGPPPDRRCAWCNKETRPRRGRSTLWPSVCAECMYPLRYVEHSLRKHHVPFDLVTALRDDPHCPICRRDLITPRRPADTDHRGGKAGPLLAVDHDHRCCPGATSCGACVRGLVCNQCNAAVGLIHEDAMHAKRMAEYLERWSDQRA